MGELNLTPDGVITDGYWTRGSFAASTSTIPSVLSDGSDSTYMSLSEDYPWNAGIYYSTIMVSYNTATLPFKARVKSVYPTARVANVGGNTSERLQMNIWKWKSGDRLTGFAGLVGGGPMAIGSSITNYKGFSTDRFPSGAVITQSDIDLLATEIFNLTDTDSRVYAAGITVVYDEQPSVEIQYPTTTTSDTTPVVSWNYFDDMESQVAVQIEIYLSSNLVYSTGTIATSDKFHEVKTALADGTYTLKIRVAQRWNGPGDMFWSEWTSQTFSVSGSLPYPPSVTVTEQTGFASVSALGYINLFPANASNFEDSGHPDWYSVNNATVSSSGGSLTRTGTRMMTVIPTGASSEIISTPVRAYAGSRYYAGYYTRNAPGTTTNTSECDISFYNSSGSLISTSAGSSATITNNTYTLFTVTATAPANTAWAAVRIKMGATSGTFLVDSAFVMLIPTGSTLPSFTSAPNMVALGGLIEESPNLLSWDNATIGANHKWTMGSDPLGNALIEADAYTSSAGVSGPLASQNSGNGFVIDVPSSGTRWMRWSGVTTVNLTKVIIKAVWSSGTNTGTIRNDTSTGTTLGSFSKVSNGSYSVYIPIEVTVTPGTLALVIVFTGVQCQVDSITLVYSSPAVTITRDVGSNQRHGDSSLKVQNTSGATNKITVSTGSLSANGSLTEASNAFEVTAGETLNVSASIWSNSNIRTYGVSIMYWTDLNAGSIGVTDLTASSVVGAWTDRTGSVTVPTGAKYAKLFLYVASTANNEIHYWDRVGVWRNSAFPFNNRWPLGSRNITGPELVVEYSEDNGVTWGEVGRTSLTSASGVIQFDDYEVAHQTDRIYRGYTTNSWDDIIRRSQESTPTSAVNIDLPNIWIHKMSNPAGSVHNFLYDGSGRNSSPGANPVLNEFSGRSYPVAFFGEVDDFQINVTIQLASTTDRAKMLDFFMTREMLVFRDQRSRRGRGVILSRTLVDEAWGQTATFVFKYAGEQP